MFLSAGEGAGKGRRQIFGSRAGVSRAADARAAFERGAVDAWVIWDPFQAAAEAATCARTLADGTGVVSNYQFYFSSKKFLQSDSGIVDLVLAQLREVDDWARATSIAVANQLAPASASG